MTFATFFRQPWAWAWIAAAATFVGTAALSAAGGLSLLSAALTFASFSVLVGLGQMFVITMGPGNADLSIPAVITLAGTLSLKFMDGMEGWALAGLGIAIGVGIACGIGNFFLIRLLAIPPIIATLSSSFIFQSVAIWSNRGLRVKPPESLAQFSVGATFGVPNMALVALGVTLLAWVALERGVYGRWISAIGQNARAARLSGVPVEGMRALTYILCAALAGLTGFVLACFSGGAALNMGTEYLLMSIAVVVIGGSSVAGGKSNVPGIWAGALFLFLIVSMLNSWGVGAGVRLILTGVIIIAIVAAASGRSRA